MCVDVVTVIQRIPRGNSCKVFREKNRKNGQEFPDKRPINIGAQRDPYGTPCRIYESQFPAPEVGLIQAPTHTPESHGFRRTLRLYKRKDAYQDFI